MDNDSISAISWDAYPHSPTPKGADWYFALTIIAVALCIAAFLLNNALLGLLILIAGGVLALSSARTPQPVTYTVSTRGLTIGDTFYPYSTLESFFIDEEDVLGPQLLVQSQKMFMPLLTIRLPDENIDEIEELIANKLPEEYLEESALYRLMEAAGL